MGHVPLQQQIHNTVFLALSVELLLEYCHSLSKPPVDTWEQSSRYKALQPMNLGVGGPRAAPESENDPEPAPDIAAAAAACAEGLRPAHSRTHTTRLNPRRPNLLSFAVAASIPGLGVSSQLCNNSGWGIGFSAGHDLGSCPAWGWRLLAEKAKLCLRWQQVLLLWLTATRRDTSPGCPPMRATE